MEKGKEGGEEEHLFVPDIGKKFKVMKETLAHLLGQGQKKAEVAQCQLLKGKVAHVKQSNQNWEATSWTKV